MQGWYYGKGLIYIYWALIKQPFAVVPALHSVLFYFTPGILHFQWRLVIASFQLEIRQEQPVSLYIDVFRGHNTQTDINQAMKLTNRLILLYFAVGAILKGGVY